MCDCSTSPPNVGVCGSNTPIVGYVCGTGLIKVSLWTVESFYVSCETLDLTCFFYEPDAVCVERTQVSMLIVYSKSCGKGSDVLRKAFVFPRGTLFR